MKVTHTIIALVILLGLGGVFYYLNKQPVQTSSSSETPKKKVFSFQADQVEEFTLETPNQPAATLRRVTPAAAPKPGDSAKPAEPSQAQWEIVSPAGVVADSAQVQSFLEELPKLEDTPLDGAAPASLADFGLDQPQKVFRFKLKQGQTVALSIGGENPSGSAKYGKLDSSPALFLLDSVDTKALEKTLFDLRDKRALPVVMDKVQRIELAFNFQDQKADQAGLPSQPGKIVMTKLSNNNWELAEPSLRTDNGNTNYFVTVLTGALMKSVEEESPKSLSSYGLDRPAIRLTVKLPDSSASLLVGSKKSGDDVAYYAKNSVWPLVFTINQSTYDQLKQDLDNYRNRYLFDFQTSGTRRVEILGPAGELRLDKKGEGWFKAGAPEKKVDGAKVDAFLDSIHNLRIQQYAADKPGQLAQYGLDKPWLRVKITFGEKNQEETILFARKDKRFYAARQGEPSVYEMAPGEPDNIEPKLKELSS